MNLLRLVPVLLLSALATALAPAAHALPREGVMDIVVEEAERRGLPVDLALAVAEAESDFRPLAISPAGARGVMQVMPRTGRDLYGLKPYELFDVRTNVRAGVDFLADLIEQYGREDIALSHYNGGSAVRARNGDLRVIPATRGYVNKVLDRRVAWRGHAVRAAERTAIAARGDDGGPRSTPSPSDPRVARASSTAVSGVERARVAAALRALAAANARRALVPGGGAVPQLAVADAEHAARVRRVRRWESFR